MSGYDVVSEMRYDAQMARAASAEQKKRPLVSECDLVLGGTYRIEGVTITLNIEAVSVSSGAVLLKKSWSDKGEDLPIMLSRTVLEMANASKVPVNDGERRAIPRMTGMTR